MLLIRLDGIGDLSDLESRDIIENCQSEVVQLKYKERVYNEI